jgi:hypothetical protein
MNGCGFAAVGQKRAREIIVGGSAKRTFEAKI